MSCPLCSLAQSNYLTRGKKTHIRFLIKFLAAVNKRGIYGTALTKKTVFYTSIKTKSFGF